MYQKNGNEIRNERGTLVATMTDDGGIVMAPGKKSQEEKVRAFLNQAAEEEQRVSPEEIGIQSSEEEPEAPEAPEAPETPFVPDGGDHVYIGAANIEHVEPPPAKEEPQTEAEWQVGTIPEEELPPFRPELGTATPGFQEYVNQHKLNNEQVSALVKRICAKKGW